MPSSPQFAKTITAVLVRLAISQREAAKRTRISPGYLSNMCLGQVPSLGKLLQFANALGVDPEPLLAAAGYAAAALHAPPPPEPGAGVPLLGHVAQDDWPQAVQDAPERYDVPAVYRAITDFCVRVAGDSMYPHLQPEDIVGVTAQSRAESGQVVVAQWGGEIIITRLLRVRDGWELTPGNPCYPPTRIADEQPGFAILGVVAWHLHRW